MAKRTVRQVLDDHAPWLPPPFDDQDAAALQALAKGSASIDQQKRVLEWIITKVCGTYDLAYRPGGEDGARDTVFALGRQFVGQQMVKVLKVKLGLLRRDVK
jgi:hypothetical protein